MLQSRVSVDNVNMVVRELKQFERTAVRDLRSDLKISLGPLAQEIAARIPREPPLSGMRHRGRTRWRGVNKPVVEFTPGRSRSGGNKLVNIRFTGGARGLGFDYAELAGIRRRPARGMSRPYERRDRPGTFQHRLNGQGDAFINALAQETGRGPGRFMFLQAVKKRPQLILLATKSLDSAARKVNRRFKMKGR